MQVFDMPQKYPHIVCTPCQSDAVIIDISKFISTQFQSDAANRDISKYISIPCQSDAVVI